MVEGYELVGLEFAIGFSVSEDIEKDEESLGGLSQGGELGSLAVGRSHVAVVRVSMCGKEALWPP